MLYSNLYEFVSLPGVHYAGVYIVSVNFTFRYKISDPDSTKLFETFWNVYFIILTSCSKVANLFLYFDFVVNI